VLYKFSRTGFIGVLLFKLLFRSVPYSRQSVNIQAPTYSRSPVLKRPEARPNRAERRGLAVQDRVNLDGGTVKKGSRWVGQVGKFIAKVPKFLAHTAKFIGTTLLGGLSAALQLAAGSIGLVGMAGLGLAGAMEVRDGVKEKDPLKMLSGSGEIVRGINTGVLSAAQLLNIGQHTGMAIATVGLGALQGGIHLTSGSMKFLQGRSEGNGQRRLEGALEVGMGVASMAMLAGPLTPLAIGTYATLSTVRFGVVNKDRIKKGIKSAKQVVKDYWQKMSDEFHGDKSRTVPLDAL
jgi:hypothetical protein